MKVKRRIHNGWEAWQNIPKEIKERFTFMKKCFFGKYQYIYSNEDVEISLVYLEVGFMKQEMMWEIFQLRGKTLFEDVERFRTKKEAVIRIKELLK